MSSQPARAQEENHSEHTLEVASGLRDAQWLADDLPQHLRVLEFIVTRALLSRSESVPVADSPSLGGDDDVGSAGA